MTHRGETSQLDEASISGLAEELFVSFSFFLLLILFLCCLVLRFYVYFARLGELASIFYIFLFNTFFFRISRWFHPNKVDFPLPLLRKFKREKGKGFTY